MQYLRFNILSLTTMDAKYREALPKLVGDLPFGSFSDDEGAMVISAIGKKARKCKKTKVGKNGMYSGEDIKVVRWWFGRDPSTSDSADARDTILKAALLEQRARETQMQIILALETLALEASATSSPALRSAPPDTPNRELDLQKKPKKPKKPQDLITLIEILVDRLCIWQSMNVEETKTSNNETEPDTQHRVNMNVRKSGNDHLRQFCVDVVLPL